MWSRKARISVRGRGGANHCILFFTNICIAVHLIEQARSIAAWTPPPIDMCAPRRISEAELRIAERRGTALADFFIRKSEFRIPRFSKVLRSPGRVTQASFRLVLEKFIERGEHESGSAGVDAKIEIDFVVKTFCLAMPNHSEQTTIDMEIRCANDAISHGEACARFAGNVIAHPG